MSTIALTHATIIDCTGADPVENGSVIVEEERIKEVSEGPPGRLPADALTIDCQGQALLPGLIDCHVHMGAIEPDFVAQQRRHYPSMIVIKTLKNMKETLDQGFTTARDCGGIDPGFRMAVAQGLMPGPRLFVAGRMISQTGGHGDDRLPTEIHAPVPWPVGLRAEVCDGVDAVRRACRDQVRQGVDFLKVMAAGGAMSPSDELDTSQYSPEELRAVVFEAESAGKYVSAHCYSDRSIRHSLQAGVRSIEHGNLMTEESAAAIKEAGAFLVPTIVTYEKIASLGRDFGIPEFNLKKIEQGREKAMGALDMAFRAGVNICSGSDLLGPMHIYKGTELELKAQVMGPVAALKATTINNARLIRQEKDLGTIEPGKLADLILVDGDPLKDIAVLQKYQTHITLIMQNGALYKKIL